MNRRCIRTELEKDTGDDEQMLLGRCYTVSCRDFEASSQQWHALEIAVDGGAKVRCARKDELSTKRVSVAGKEARLTCPLLDVYCIGRRPFACVHGWHSEQRGECVCNVGWKGARCQLRHTPIYDYPPMHRFHSDYVVPGLRASLVVECVDGKGLDGASARYTIQVRFNTCEAIDKQM